MRSRTLRPGWAILVAVLCFAGAKLLIIDAALVRGPSMRPTIADGSLVLVLRCAYGIPAPFRPGYLFTWARPRRGEVVAASNPLDGASVVKRVAAVGPLSLSLAAGHLVGPAFDAPLTARQAERWADGLRLLPDTFFLLGDNPPESLDSRDYGAIPIEGVSGRVLLFGMRAKP